MSGERRIRKNIGFRYVHFSAREELCGRIVYKI